MEESLVTFTPLNYKESESDNEDVTLKPVRIPENFNEDEYLKAHESFVQEQLQKVKENSGNWLETVGFQDEGGKCYFQAMLNLMVGLGIGHLPEEERKQFGNPAAVHIYNDGMVISSWFEGEERNIMIKGKSTYIDKNICDCEGCHER